MEDKNFEKKRKEFRKNISSLDTSLDEFSKKTTKGTSKTKNISSISTIKDNSSKVSSSINELSKDLKNASKGLENSTRSMERSGKKLELILQRQVSTFKKLNMQMVQFGKNFTREIGRSAIPVAMAGGRSVVRGAGSVGRGVVRGTGKVAAAPFKATGRGVKYYTSGQQEALSEMSDMDVTSQYKKNLGGSAISKLGGGVAGGAFLGSMLMGMKNMAFGSGSDKSRIKEWGAFLGRKAVDTFKGILHGVENTAKWLKDLIPEEAIADDVSIYTSPGQEFEDLMIGEKKSLAASIKKANSELLGVKEGKTYSISDQLSDTLREVFSPHSGMFSKVFSVGLGIDKVISYAIPVFGAGYKSELPKVRRVGMIQGIYDVLALSYVHSRFASNELNNLLIQQSQLLQAGFNLEGSLKRPRARSLSEMLGNMIKDWASPKLSPFLEMGKSFGAQKFSSLQDELKGSPFKKKSMDIWEKIKDSLESMKETIIHSKFLSPKLPSYKSGTRRIPGKKGEEVPFIGHAGESVIPADEAERESAPKGGIFSKIFGGILNIFSGNFFKDVREKLTGIWESVKSFVSEKFWTGIWENAKKNPIISPFVDLAQAIRETFQVRGKGGGFIQVLRELPEALQYTIENVFKNLSSWFTSELEKKGPNSFLGRVAKAFATITPGFIKATFKTLLTEIENLSLDVTKIWPVLVDAMVEMGKSFKSYADVIKNSKNSKDGFFGGLIKQIKSSFSEIPKLGKGILTGIKNLGMNLLTISANFEFFKIRSRFALLKAYKELREQAADKVLPENWKKGHKVAEEVYYKSKRASFDSMMSAFDFPMSETWKKYNQQYGVGNKITTKSGQPFKSSGAARRKANALGEGYNIVKQKEGYVVSNEEKHAKLKRTGSVGKDLFSTILKPFTDIIGVIKNALIEFKDALVLKKQKDGWKGLFHSFAKDLGELKNNIKSVSKEIGKKGKLGMDIMRGKEDVIFRDGEMVQAASGGVVKADGAIYTHSGEIIGKPDDIINWLSQALTKNSSFDNSPIISRLDTIIDILNHLKYQTSPSVLGESIKSGIKIGTSIVVGTIKTTSSAIVGSIKVLTEITKFGFKIAGSTFDGIKTILFNILGAIKETGKFVVSKIGSLFKGIWSIVTSPFKFIKNMIMKPFEWMKEKYEKVKEKAKQMVGSIWSRIKGEDTVAVTPDGKEVKAKWPGRIIKLLNYQLKIQKKILGVLGETKFQNKKLHGESQKTLKETMKKFGSFLKDKILWLMMSLGSAILNVGKMIFGGIGRMVTGLASGLGVPLKGIVTPKMMGGAALAGGLLWGAADAASSVGRAGEIHGVSQDKLKTSHKVTAGIGGFLGGDKGGVGGAAKGAAKGALIGAGLGTVVPFFGTIAGGLVGGLIGGLLGAIGGDNIARGIQTAWDSVKSVASKAWDAMLGIFKWIPETFGKIKDWVSSKWDKMGGVKGFLKLFLGSMVKVLPWIMPGVGFVLAKTISGTASLLGIKLDEDLSQEESKLKSEAPSSTNAKIGNEKQQKKKNWFTSLLPNYSNVFSSGDSKNNSSKDYNSLIEDETNKNLGRPYGMGKKGEGSGAIDCSGFTELTQNRVLKDSLNAKTIPTGSLNSSQQIMNSKPIDLSSLNSGDLIGIDTPNSRGFGKISNVDHIVQVYQDTKSGKLMISESAGKIGVRKMPLDTYLNKAKSKGWGVYPGRPDAITAAQRSFGDGVVAAADGALLTGKSPLMLVDMNSGQPVGIAAESGPEVIVPMKDISTNSINSSLALSDYSANRYAKTNEKTMGQFGELTRSQGTMMQNAINTMSNNISTSNNNVINNISGSGIEDPNVERILLGRFS